MKRAGRWRLTSATGHFRKSETTMGIALTVYSVPWKELLAVPGSRREELIQEIVRGYPEHNLVNDVTTRMFEDDLPNTCEEAVRQIVEGAPLDAGKGTLYAYAVEAICWYLGTKLGARFGLRVLEELDQFLGPLHCPVSLWDLGSRGSPVPIPEPGNPPSVGFWSEEEVMDVGVFFENLRLEGAEERIVRGVAEINRWLDVALDQDAGLVGFEY
jgi:hypothetical protein